MEKVEGVKICQSYMCVHVCVCTCVHTCVCVHVCVHTCVRVCVRVHVFVCAWVCTCVWYVFAHLCGCTCPHSHRGWRRTLGYWVSCFINTRLYSLEMASVTEPRVRLAANKPAILLLPFPGTSCRYTWHIWLFMWLPGIWTQVFMPGQQGLFPTKPSPQFSLCLLHIRKYGTIFRSHPDKPG